jgi:hypothetical protein
MLPSSALRDDAFGALRRAWTSSTSLWSNGLMTFLSRTIALVLIAVPAFVSPSFAQAVDVWTVGVNNTRQGWNKFESVLTPANVSRLKKIREFIVDEKIDVSPLVVGDKLYVFTMTNTAYIFDVNTGVQLATPRQLAAPFDPRPDPGQMDKWKIYHNWGITATPVIDVATNTIYATTFGKPNANSQNTERNNMLWILDANTLADKKPPVLIEGNADNGGGGIANGFTTPYQKMRAGLGLLTDAGGNKAVVISFSINVFVWGENEQLKAYNFAFATKRITSFRGEGTQLASGNMAAPALVVLLAAGLSAADIGRRATGVGRTTTHRSLKKGEDGPP